MKRLIAASAAVIAVASFAGITAPAASASDSSAKECRFTVSTPSNYSDATGKMTLTKATKRHIAACIAAKPSTPVTLSAPVTGGRDLINVRAALEAAFRKAGCGDSWLAKPKPKCVLNIEDADYFSKQYVLVSEPNAFS